MTVYVNVISISFYLLVEANGDESGTTSCFKNMNLYIRHDFPEVIRNGKSVNDFNNVTLFFNV